MRINTNVASLQAQEANKNTNNTIASSLEKLSTGKQINRAADNASGLAIADKLRTQASSIGQGISNATSANALIQIADKAMSEQSNILDTVKTKLLQAATDTTTADGREAIRKDVTKLLEQFDAIASQTNYNGITLLQVDDSANAAVQSTLTFQLGEEAGYDVTLTQTRASNTNALGGGANAVTEIGAGDSVNLAFTTGTATLVAASAGASFELNGSLGNQVDMNAGDVTDFAVTTENQDMINYFDSLADATTAVSGSNGSYIITETLTVDFGTAKAADLTISSATAAAEVEVDYNAENVDFSVKNNSLATDMGTTGVNGGALLSNIKNLGADELTNTLANTYINTVDEALSQLNANRSDFGSAQNKLESAIRNMQTTQTNLQAAESVIRDVDYAAESANFNKQNIIAQAGTYAMSQANAVSQNVLRLLQ